MHIILRRPVVIAMMVPLLGMHMPMSAFAADINKTTADKVAVSPKNFHLIRASTLVGQNVENTQGENLGDIKDLILDISNERVFYAVLEFGGFLGMGEKLFAYPIRVFKYTGGNLDKLVLNVDKAKLKAAPGFARDRWPDWLTYGDEVNRYYGDTVKLKELPDQKLGRASELIGKAVNDRAGKDIGEIEEIVVDMNNGKVHYVVLKLDESWNLNKLISLPLRAFTYTAEKDELVLNVDKPNIDTTRAFDKDRWLNLNDQAYVVDVDRYLTADVRTAPAGTPEARFMRVDSNSDGVISKVEADSDASVRKAWISLDKDRDGIVSRADFLGYEWK